jgi:predicted helicase
VVTARDEWVYDFSEDWIDQKVRFLIDGYNSEVDRHFGEINREQVVDELDYSIKRTRAVKNDLAKGRKYAFVRERIVSSTYRPFVRRKVQLPLVYLPAEGPPACARWSWSEEAGSEHKP